MVIKFLSDYIAKLFFGGKKSRNHISYTCLTFVTLLLRNFTNLDTMEESQGNRKYEDSEQQQIFCEIELEGKGKSNETGAKSPTEIQYETFQNWATQNYGETSKTKTVTTKKYNRICKILTGEETPSTENGKFRSWVRNKGFKLAPSSWANQGIGTSSCQDVLYVPTKVQVSENSLFISFFHLSKYTYFCVAESLGNF